MRKLILTIIFWVIFTLMFIFYFPTFLGLFKVFGNLMFIVPLIWFILSGYLVYLIFKTMLIYGVLFIIVILSLSFFGISVSVNNLLVDNGDSIIDKIDIKYFPNPKPSDPVIFENSELNILATENETLKMKILNILKCDATLDIRSSQCQDIFLNEKIDSLPSNDIFEHSIEIDGSLSDEVEICELIFKLEGDCGSQEISRNITIISE